MNTSDRIDNIHTFEKVAIVRYIFEMVIFWEQYQIYWLFIAFTTSSTAGHLWCQACYLFVYQTLPPLVLEEIDAATSRNTAANEQKQRELDNVFRGYQTI